MASLRNQIALITGASMGIGAAIARQLAAEGINLILFARNMEKLQELHEEIKGKINKDVKVYCCEVDIQNYEQIDEEITRLVKDGFSIDILINNAGLALGAPSPFPSLSIPKIVQMNNTNINGLMFVTYSVLKRSMMKQDGGIGRGTILNISSTTALEAPPFPGEAVYHAGKACQEGFTNALRNELSGSNIKVLVLRPGVVKTHFHRQRVGYDEEQFEQFMDGFQPLEADDVARSALYMLQQPPNISIKALDVVPTAQRSLTVFDRDWNNRQH